MDSAKRTRGWKKFLGPIIIGIALLCWLLIPVLALLKLDAVLFASITAVLLVLSEVLNWIGVALLGKEVWNQLRARISLKRLFKKHG